MKEFFSNYANEFLYGTYVLLGICIALAIILPLINSVSNPRSMLKTGAGAVILGILFLICLGTASGDLSFTDKQFEDVSAVEVRNIGAIIRMTYVLIIGAVGGLVITELIKIKF